MRASLSLPSRLTAQSLTAVLALRSDDMPTPSLRQLAELEARSVERCDYSNQTQPREGASMALFAIIDLNGLDPFLEIQTAGISRILPPLADNIEEATIPFFKAGD